MQIEAVEVNKRSAPTYNRGRRPDFRSYERAPRIYVAVKGENVLENLQNRLSRPSKLYASAIPDAIAALGLDPKEYRATWSQYAGCSCPCSPAFILKAKKPGGADTLRSLHSDVWVTVTGDDAAVDPEIGPRTL